MLIRANTLARGHSGIRLSTLQLLVEMLNAGVHPVIPEKGSLGASGEAFIPSSPKKARLAPAATSPPWRT